MTPPPNRVTMEPMEPMEPQTPPDAAALAAYADAPLPAPVHPETPDWLSAYLFFPQGIYTGECDRVVLDVCEPFVRRAVEEGWADGHFFIRYSEYGPHARLRLHGDPAVLDEVVWPALQAHVRSVYPNVRDGRPTPGEPLTGEPGEVTHLARVGYEPETERYGGPDGVRLAERCFEVSSEAAYALLKKTHPTERSSRLGKGLLTMVVLAHAFNRDRTRAARFSHQYGINYLRAIARDEEGRDAWLGAFGSGFDQQAENLAMYVDEVWSRMDEGEELSDALDAYHDGLKEVVARFDELLASGRLLARGEEPFTDRGQAVMAITSSYWHMMNNRLGISIQEESYLAYLIMRALEAPADAVAS